jgi:hypothetical protein
VLQEAHQRYVTFSLLLCPGATVASMNEIGDVLQVSPNELSFASADAPKAIHGAQKTAPIVKSDSYDMIGINFNVSSLGSEQSLGIALQKLRKLRKLEPFAEAFSNRNLAKQESAMYGFVDFLIGGITELGNRYGLEHG